MMDDDANWYGPDAATFGDRVAAAREQADMTQAVLAKRLGVRLATLRGWEDDLSEPRANRLSMLAGLLNVSMMWLINGEGEGISAPDTAVNSNSDIAGILAEMREIRTEMLQKAARIGRLEKRLRGVVQESNNV
ncbi:Helix-turn-helix [Sulfitobacter brevis]|uniref:Helix-turn-helix n=2 Tax=Sulfitobacter brevis TaxID=74348 RepID=A0A1I2AVJ1_9RHOB|nr:Helix-turn-helix [Sulfitobacter brevis]